VVVNRVNRLDYDEPLDPLAAARGAVHGLILGALLWIVAALLCVVAP